MRKLTATLVLALTFSTPAICQKEKEADHIERGLIQAVFAGPLDKADKILLKELFLQIGDLSDRAENAGDRLRIIAVKRPI